jgi:hypothetical protein
VYELPPDVDLAFLVGCEVQQIRLGQFQTVIAFDRDVVIDIGAEFTLDGTRLDASEGYVLHILLGEVIAAVTRVTAVDLELSCGLHRLVLHGVDRQYESYNITHRGGLIVV